MDSHDWLCSACRENGLTVEARIVHHVKPVREGGAIWDPENLTPLCKDCHEQEHAHERPKPASEPEAAQDVAAALAAVVMRNAGRSRPAAK